MLLSNFERVARCGFESASEISDRSFGACTTRMLEWAQESRVETPTKFGCIEAKNENEQNFGKMLLVFGCIGTDFCKKIRVLQHFSKSTKFSSWKFWNLAIFCKFCDICEIFAEFSRKLLFFQTDFLRKFWDCSGAEVCKSCRAWKMLSNAYFLAKFRFDTAENEPAKKLQICQFCQH